MEEMGIEPHFAGSGIHGKHCCAKTLINYTGLLYTKLIFQVPKDLS